MPLSTYAGNAVLDALFNNTALQVAAAYVSLHSGDPGLTGANELSGNGYGRVQMEFDAPTNGVTANTNVESFGPAVTGNWAAATYWGLWDQQAAGGNFLWGDDLTTPRTCLVGEYVDFAAGDLDLTIGAQFGNTTRTNIINALLRNTALQVAAAYMSLHSADPGATGASELTGNNYGPRPAASFGAAGSRSIANDAAAQTTDATPAGWTEATFGGLWAANAAGVFIWGDQLTVARTVGIGKHFTAAIGDIVVNAY